MSLKTEFRMGITQKVVAFGQDCKAVIPADDVDGLFLAYTVKSLNETILGMVDEASHGTGRLQTEPLQKLSISIPPLEQQRAISRLLGRLDEQAEINRRINQGLIKMRDLLLPQLLSGDLCVQEADAMLDDIE